VSEETAAGRDLPRSGRCVVFGVLNVTPDSFSDGGRWVDPDAAAEHGLAMADEGADVVDVGGESTRPGAHRVDPEEESRRVVPVVRALAAAAVRVSVDTSRAAVADAALDAGATIVNDVSGGLADSDMAKVVATAGVPWVLMHWRGHSRDMQALATYDDVVADVRTELVRQADIALAAGVEPDRIVLDPGLGFAKTAEHNWSLLARLDEIVAVGFPVLVGASRKSFLGKVLAGPDGEPAPVDARESATVATSVLAAVMGAWGVRVHAVRPTVDALKVVQAWSRAAEHATAAEEIAGPPVPRPRGTGRG